jgi:hypothetical protein
MNDTTTAADAARVAAETEASREIATQAAPDDPNPPDTSPLPDPLPSRLRDGEPAGAEGGGEVAAKPLERITASDRSRADIAARFKEKRAARGGQVEFHGDMRDPSQTYGPLGLALEQMPDDGGQRSEEALPAQTPPVTTEAPPVEPAPPSSDIRHPTSDESRLIKVKVHGREAWLPEGEVIAEAQKSLAAGNLLESAKEVLAGARDQRSEQHPSSVLGPLSSASDPYMELAQTLQLDDAAAAGLKLRTAIESETSKARQDGAREAARQVRIENELAVSQKALQAFEKTHPEVAADEFARDAITTQVGREINADLQRVVAQGILKELPKTQDERNGLHTQLRAFGAPVRPIGELFDAAGNKYAAWRGTAPPKPEIISHKAEDPAADFHVPTSARPAPRVELSPDRAQRRATIVAQPTNGTVPPRAAQPAPELTMAQRRSAAVMAMRKARGQIVA